MQYKIRYDNGEYNMHYRIINMVHPDWQDNCSKKM